ncbi:amidohydrolase [Bacillus infantis]|uniref:amidohydrolase n=1 Tax=Bacillus infantis TaxID=324767 RepID=UPI003CEB78C8
MRTLWHGGYIYTLQEEGHKAEAVMTENGKILRAGPLEELKRNYSVKPSEMRDLEGSLMLPGFVDSHMHLIGHGERLIRLDLSGCTSKTEVLDAVKEYAEKFPKGSWVIGEGWNENLWDIPAPILAKELDEAVPEHPVCLKRICRHAIAVNSKALEAGGIIPETICPPGGVIEKDEAGLPSGLLKDQAQELIFSILPGASKEYLETAMRAAIQDAYAMGLTGAHTEDLNYYGGFHGTYRTFKEVIGEDKLPFRAHLLVHHEVINDMKLEGGNYLGGNEWIEFGAMKIFSDGALGGRTALLSHPYADDPSTSGVAIFTQDQLDGLLKKARELDMPVAIHAIGDRAFEMSLNSIEKYPLKGKGRDRLIHAQILRKELIPRAKKLPLILDIQPRFLASDFPWVISRIGEEHMDYCYAWKTLIDEGIPCAGGSDAPIEQADPLLGIHSAVTRTSSADPGRIAYFKEEALSMYEAVSLYTKGSAYAICHEDDRGMIKDGFLADFTILDRNIFEEEPEALLRTRVNETVIGGKTVYKRGQV